VIVEARRVDEASAAACNQCAEGGRRPIEGHSKTIASAIQTDSLNEAAQWNCFCAIDQVTGADKDACQNDVSPSPVSSETGEAENGWCYVDATTTPSTGNPAIVSGCAPTERHLVRFVGDSGEQPGSTLFIQCESSPSSPTCP
jgi:hypothetical protein